MIPYLSFALLVGMYLAPNLMGEAVRSVPPPVVHSRSSVGSCESEYFRSFSGSEGLDDWTAWSGDWKLEAGSLRLELDSDVPHRIPRAVALRDCAYRNVVYEARVRARGGALSLEKWGLVVRGINGAQGPGSFVAATLDSDHYFTVYEYTSHGGVTVLLSRRVKLSPRGWRIIKVDVRGRRMIAFVNGKRVGRVRWAKGRRGSAGLIASRLDADVGHYVFEVDWLSIRAR